MRTTWLFSIASLIYGRKYFPTKNKKKQPSHTHLKLLTAMATSVTVNSASLFPCLDYMDSYLPLCRGSLKRIDKCFIKRTKIDQTHLIKNRVVASFKTGSRPVPLEILSFVSRLKRIILQK